MAPCLLATGLIQATGCSDDETPAGIGILKAELNFDALGGKGYALVSETGYQASVSEDWCRIEQKADSIIVYAEENTTWEGRTAMLTVLGTDGSTQQLPVSQRGGIFYTDIASELYTGDEPTTIPVTLSSVFEYEVKATEPWVSHEPAEGGITLHLEANTTGMPRRAGVSLSCPKMGREYAITLYQYSLADLAGTWTATYKVLEGNATKKQETPVTLALHDGGGMELSGLYSGVTLLADADGHTFSFATGRAIGTLGSYDLYQYGTTSDFQIYSNEKEPVRKYVAHLAFPDEGGLELSFQADSIFYDGNTMAGLGIYGRHSDTGAGRTVTAFTDLKLKMEE